MDHTHTSFAGLGQSHRRDMIGASPIPDGPAQRPADKPSIFGLGGQKPDSLRRHRPGQHHRFDASAMHRDGGDNFGSIGRPSKCRAECRVVRRRPVAGVEALLPPSWPSPPTGKLVAFLETYGRSLARGAGRQRAERLRWAAIGVVDDLINRKCPVDRWPDGGPMPPA
jgi:hypothetical protein